ncbi:MAG: DUF6020 family protein [Oscillospiraceae bacterium]|jgi:hypothetical protein|nr:DUF6020 family protein [Oscillospiraceae bacterium]
MSAPPHARWARVRAAVKTDARARKRVFVLAALLAAAFCICLPVNDVYGRGLLPPYRPTAALILGFLLGCPAFYVLLTALRGRAARFPDAQAGPAGLRPAWRRWLCYGAAPVLACVLSARALYPGIFTTDSLSQLRQVMGLEPLYDWHPVGHTLLFYGIPYSLTGALFSVTLTQLALYAFTWAFLFSELEGMGLRRRYLLPVNIAVAFIPTNLFLSIALWKDIPFACASVLATALLIRVHRSGGQALHRRPVAVGLGVTLGLMAVLRHNGPFVVPFLLLALLLVHRRHLRYAVLSAGVALALLAGVRVVGFGVLHAKPNNPAVSFRWFTQIAGGILTQDGQITDGEKAVMEKILPLADWRARYNPYSNDPLMSTPGVRVWDNLEAHRGEMAHAAAAMALRNPVKALRAEMDITEVTWRILPLGPVNVTSYQNRLDDFDLQIRETPRFLMLKNAMETVYQDPLWQVLFCRLGLYFFLTLCLLTLSLARRDGGGWLCFLPVLLNVASLWISMPSQDYRYAYSLVFAFPLLALWSFAPVIPHRKGKKKG